MRISAKGRYAIAATISMAQEYEKGECTTIITLSKKLNISKIYLEQVFSLLKRMDIVISTKGPQGGYRLTRTPNLITVFDILTAVETSLFERAGKTVLERTPEIEKAMNIVVFEQLDTLIIDFLSSISLADLVSEAAKHTDNENYMFYI